MRPLSTAIVTCALVIGGAGACTPPPARAARGPRTPGSHGPAVEVARRAPNEPSGRGLCTKRRWSRRVPAHGTTHLAFSPDGAELAVALEDGKTRLEVSSADRGAVRGSVTLVVEERPFSASAELAWQGDAILALDHYELVVVDARALSTRCAKRWYDHPLSYARMRFFMGTGFVDPAGTTAFALLRSETEPVSLATATCAITPRTPTAVERVLGGYATEGFAEAAITSDGRHLFVAPEGDRAVEVWDLASRAKIAPPAAAEFAPDQFFTTPSREETTFGDGVRIVDPATRAPRVKRTVPQRSTAVSPTGSHLAEIDCRPGADGAQERCSLEVFALEACR